MQIIFFTRFVSMEMAAICYLRALTKVYSFVIYKSAISNAMRSGTHVADKKYYEETYTSILTFVEYFILIIIGVT